MGGYAQRRYFDRRFTDTEEDVRRLKLRHTAPGLPFWTSHTFIIGGPITTDLYVPPAVFMVNYNLEDTPETQLIDNFATYVRTGSVTVRWSINEGAVAPLSLPVTLADGTRTRIRPVITEATGAEDLSIALSIKHFPGQA